MSVIPEAAVEAAAKAIYEDGWLGPPFWESLAGDNSTKVSVRLATRKALEAAAPHLTERAYNAGHLDGTNGSPNNNPYR